MKRVRLQDVADQLNISRITVSKVINNKPGVAYSTRKKVLRTLVDHGYDKLDEAVLALIANEAPEPVRRIAVLAIAPEFSEFWLKTINSIAAALTDSGYEFVYSFLSRNDENQFVLPKIIDKNSISGVIVINVYDDVAIQALSEADIATVFLDTTPRMYHQRTKGDIVLLDGSRSIYAITSHIIEKGRTNIGFVGDITYSKTILDRWKGFKQAMKDHNLPLNPRHCLTRSDYGHYYYMSEIEQALDNLEEMPDAFVCANDFIAFMLIDYLKKHGYQIPTDIAVSGYDDIREKITAASKLTTVTIDNDLLGKRLVQQVLMRVNNPQMPSEIIFIQSDVVFRNSTAF